MPDRPPPKAPSNPFPVAAALALFLAAVCGAILVAYEMDVPGPPQPIVPETPRDTPPRDTPSVPPPPSPAPPPEVERAMAIRQDAVKACIARDFSTCEALLNQAAGLDPKGDQTPYVRSWREAIAAQGR